MGENDYRADCSRLPASIRSYQPCDRDRFIELNLDWIEERFVVEDSDREQLERPEETILARGGHIVVAELAGRVIGCGAIQPPPHLPHDGRKWLELIKLATERKHRGRGIGRAVLTRLIADSKSMGADALWLETNSALTAAIRLYEKIGFQHLPADELWPTPFERCNVQMTMDL